MAVIRKKTGNFLEDFRVGQVFRHKGGKTVTDGLFNAFTEFNMTTNPLHKNREAARLYGYADMICPPGLVMNVVFSQTVEDISENARANLEYINMRFGAPVYPGDTLESETTILGVTPSSKDPDRGVVHVATVGRKQTGDVVIAFERKVQVWKSDLSAKVEAAELGDQPQVACTPWLPPFDAARGYEHKAHLSNRDTYFEDFHAGDLYEHSRGRMVTDEHIALTAQLDNTSQVHCNQHMIDQNPDKYIGGRLIIYGGIPFNLCLGISCPDIADNALADVVYTTGRHVGPLFAGDTVFAATEIRATRDYPGREDLGVLAVTLRGHKFRKPKEGEQGPQKVDIFVLERELAVKRRSHYA
ncbi:MAG: MaoC family dehydratase N-terminal domain-containing protein [Deltaproteobacteria bacterium]|nr:MaoC family dehydratase N-terminal domain-containing protein [Deltaproteobacteria bacterium]